MRQLLDSASYGLSKSVMPKTSHRMSERPLVTSQILVGLQSYVQSRDLDFGALARSVGIDVKKQKAIGFVGFDALSAMFDAIAEATNDEACGLHFAEASPPTGLVHYAIKNAPTLHEALLSRIQYTRLLVNAFEVDLRSSTDFSTFEWTSNDATEIRASRHFVDYLVGILIVRIREMLGDAKWLPLQVGLAHSAPQSDAEFKRIFGPRIVYSSRNWVRIGSQDLDRKLPGADAHLYRHLRSSLERLRGPELLARSTFDRVRAFLVTATNCADADEAITAAAIGVSVRSLQRELKMSGSSFRHLQEEARKRLALHLLYDTDLPLTEIAYQLGYSELSAFSRASKLWFGEPANRMRKKLK